MDSNWKNIYNSQDSIHVNILKNMLEANGIKAIVLNKQDSAYLSFGDIELYVQEKDILKSKHLIYSDNE